MSLSQGDLGSGVGKGGGGGGTIREAGGSLGKRQVAQEEEYFYKKQKEQLSRIKTEKVQEPKNNDKNNPCKPKN